MRRLLAAVAALVLVFGPTLGGDAAFAHHRPGHDRGRPTPTTTPRPTLSPTPTPAPTASATPAPSADAWRVVHDDGFATWDPGRYFVYPATWGDTEEQARAGLGGRYGGAIRSDGSVLRLRLGYVDGVPRGVAFCPIPAGSLSDRGDLESMRVEFRIRADRMAGWKGVPLLWPISGHAWPEWGEINWPESSFDARPSAFMHRQGATSGSDQDWYPAPDGTSWQDWHTYRIEWVAGAYAAFWIDGQLVGRSTSRVPAGPMHLVMQFETAIDGRSPDPSVAGEVMIDFLTIWTQTGG